MPRLWTDGTWTTATAVTLPAKTSPIPGVADAVVFTQDYMQIADNWTAGNVGGENPSGGAYSADEHPTESGFFLALEGPRLDLQGGIVRWTRTYAKIPPTHYDEDSYNYKFPGFAGALAWFSEGFYTVATGTPLGREPITKTVNCRITSEYFLIAAGQPYTSAFDIPVVSGQKYYVEAESVQNDYLRDYDPYPIASTPSRTTYESWITSGQLIVPEDSRLDRWMGNIWVRRTRRIRAE